MIYELSLVTKAKLSAEEITVVNEMVRSVVKEYNGETFVEDDWGVKTFAQPTAKGVTSGHYMYFIFQADAANNVELNRRFKIDESILKSIIIKLSDDDNEAGNIVKEYKSPFSKKYAGSVTDKEEIKESEKERRMFSKRRTCWFTINKIKADWKDPSTFSWLVNEFGKISPARVSGIARRHQRLTNLAIKRARQIGLASYVSNRLAE